ncbi:penicillin-binding protein activator [Vibrio agarivorans]|uniref:Penicillin-binding protein activator LpoA n=1 Tax=Vibrio agarivorans TaxID=153622 RepID=A0ABT7Y1U5_9VIBR|nr:penicillin-binding protein activator [Vibrio agarivorans]MDN2482006.1 penicillin-binding protein activator [Vibrio agarivorans]
MAKKNHKKWSVPRLLTPVALAMTIAACSSTPQVPDSVDITQDPVQDSQTYLIRADSTQDSLQADWLIMALKAAIKEGDDDLASRLITRIQRLSLSPVQQAEWQLSRADLYRQLGEYSKAISGLNFQPNWDLPAEQWEEYYELRADLFEQQSSYFNANRELVAMAQYAPASSQQLISERIWSNFAQYDGHQINRLTVNQNEAVLAGWLDLARIFKTQQGNIAGLKSTLDNWMEANSQHPAAFYTPKAITEILALEISLPSKTALLLPLSGKYKGQSELIREGFILAMMNDDNRDPDSHLIVIDTTDISSQDLKSQIIDNQVDFIVGPLKKSSVEMLQEIQGSLPTPIPTLALNIPEDIETGYGTCYLALSPEQEVAQAAKYLAEEGYQFPLILAPNNNLGKRVTKAFQEEWAQQATTPVAIDLFANKNQLQRNINNVFGLQQSQQRIAQMSTILGTELETQARSRRDIDSVYIVADSSDLTLIKPFIEVAINPDTTPPKLFSSSRSNSSSKPYEDLTGVIFSDIPLLIQPDQDLKAQMDNLWPSGSKAQRRLQALGMDAYLLMLDLPQMKVVPETRIDGNTGRLSINEQCVVEREISWAEYGTF